MCGDEILKIILIGVFLAYFFSSRGEGETLKSLCSSASYSLIVPARYDRRYGRLMKWYFLVEHRSYNYTGETYPTASFLWELPCRLWRDWTWACVVRNLDKAWPNVILLSPSFDICRECEFVSVNVVWQTRYHVKSNFICIQFMWSVLKARASLYWIGGKTRSRHSITTEVQSWMCILYSELVKNTTELEPYESLPT
jgi:hypothetical protein